MKANELRNHNWVNINGQPYTVNGAFLAEIEKKNCTWVKSISFVEVTAAILEKIGFTTDEFKVEYRIGLPIGEGSDLFIEDEGHPIMSCGIKNDKHYNYFKDIRYVHQLQNLYFAISGEELEVKL